jgi:hypothetical protein
VLPLQLAHSHALLLLPLPLPLLLVLGVASLAAGEVAGVVGCAAQGLSMLLLWIQVLLHLHLAPS